ncbi:MAG: site-specific DNA-methyltransferase [Casimicrobium sp.]
MSRYTHHAEQFNLFDVVAEGHLLHPERLTTRQLYGHVAATTGLDVHARSAIGQAQVQRSPVERKVRWIQQTLKQLGLIAPVAGERGAWRLTASGKAQLSAAPPGQLMVACSTRLGLALWGNHEDVFSRLDVPITLCLTSPPYPLAKARAYGGPKAEEYVDFVCDALEPIVRNLRAGGSIALNISNDIFEPKSPARSLYRERLAIALYERLGLHKMDELIWENPSKPPGPTYWSSINRFHLTSTWEPVLWFTNNPVNVIADNRRVLVPHKPAQERLIARGGSSRQGHYGDGAYKLRNHSYGASTAGAIPRNILRYQHNCPDKTALAAAATQLGLPTHGATMPLALADFLVRYLSAPDDMIVDPFGGWLTTAKAAEQNGRRWIVTERMGEYALAGIERLRTSLGFV